MELKLERKIDLSRDPDPYVPPEVNVIPGPKPQGTVQHLSMADLTSGRNKEI